MPLIGVVAVPVLVPVPVGRKVDVEMVEFFEAVPVGFWGVDAEIAYELVDECTVVVATKECKHLESCRDCWHSPSP